MQIFSPSHTRSSLSKRSSRRGFTLVEMLVSMAIMGIISTIVMVKYSVFDSTVLLKNKTYEIALLIRESQVKAVSVAQSTVPDPDQQFDFPYGVSFSPESGIYTAFVYKHPSDYPKFEAPYVETVRAYDLGGTMQVESVCVITTNPSTCEEVDRLDISFRRPEFGALFYITGSAISPSAINFARIQVHSTKNDAEQFVVEISRLGQISVSVAETP